MSEAQGAVTRVGTDSEGRTVLAMPYSEQLAKKAVTEGLARQTSNKTDSDADKTEFVRWAVGSLFLTIAIA